jgi:hypothetical protein
MTDDTIDKIAFSYIVIFTILVSRPEDYYYYMPFTKLLLKTNLEAI